MTDHVYPSKRVRLSPNSVTADRWAIVSGPGEPHRTWHSYATPTGSLSKPKPPITPKPYDRAERFRPEDAPQRRGDWELLEIKHKGGRDSHHTVVCVCRGGMCLDSLGKMTLSEWCGSPAGGRLSCVICSRQKSAVARLGKRWPKKGTTMQPPPLPAANTNNAPPLLTVEAAKE